MIDLALKVDADGVFENAPGCTIEWFADYLIRTAKLRTRAVCGRHNDFLLTAFPESAVADVVRPWNDMQIEREQARIKAAASWVKNSARFKIGDMVVLNSGGPTMTVYQIASPSHGSPVYEVTWFVAGEVKRDGFAEPELRPVSARGFYPANYPPVVYERPEDYRALGRNIVEDLREIGRLQPGDPMPAWAQPNEWGRWISSVANRAANAIETLRAKREDTNVRLDVKEFGR